MRLLSSLDPQRDRYSGNRLAQGLFDARHQLQEIRQPIGPRLEHEDGDGERRQVLLKGQVAIDRDEDVELPCRRCQQGTVLEASNRFSLVISRCVPVQIMSPFSIILGKDSICMNLTWS